MANQYGSKIKSYIWVGNYAFRISQTFRQHRARGGVSKRLAGIDVAIPTGYKLRVKDPGVVYNAFTDSSGAKIVTVKHKGFFTQYAHLSRILVRKGQRVKLNTKIGISGASGKVTGAHLHYAYIKGTRYNNVNRIDPYAYLVAFPKLKPKPKLDPCKSVKVKLKNVEKLREIDQQIIKELIDDKTALKGIIGDLEDNLMTRYTLIEELEIENERLNKRWFSKINWTLMLKSVLEWIKRKLNR